MIVGHRSLGDAPTCDPNLLKNPPRLPTIVFLDSLAGQTTNAIVHGEFAGVFALDLHTFVTEAATASGGNQYWRSAWVSDKSAAAQRAFAYAKKTSQRHFADYFGPNQDYADWRMSDVLSHYAGKLATRYGAVAVDVQPDPSERADAFVRRGGYLLWTDPQTGVFGGTTPIYEYGWGQTPIIASDELGTGVATVTTAPEYNLFINYDVNAGKVQFVVRFAPKSTTVWDVVTYPTKKLSDGIDLVCGHVNDSKLATVAAAATVIPGSAPYLAAWGGIAALCHLKMPTPAAAAATAATACPKPALPAPPMVVAPPPVAPPTPVAWYATPRGKLLVAGGITALAAVALLRLLPRKRR